MVKKRLLITLFLSLFLFISNFLFAQSKNDSITIDTIKIENKKKSKFKKFYRRLLFKNPKNANFPLESNNRNEKLYEGKIIRNIHYKTQDPFGYSLKDTTKHPTKWLERAGNKLHVKSKKFVLKQNVLFKEGQKYDSIKVYESERLIRTNRSIRKVEIDAQLVGKDSVDLYVNSIDSWSIFVNGSLSSSRTGISIKERNFLGLGHVLDNRYKHNYKTGKSRYQFDYTVPNIVKTRIEGNIHYYKDENDYYNKSINFIRPFYSPLAHYAGGISVGQIYFQDSLDFKKERLEINNFKYNFQDYWLARAFRIDKNKSTTNITNFIISTRFYKKNYDEKPTIQNDPVDFFSDQTNYMVGIGISSRRYVKTRFIYNYNIDEDIAVGKSFGLISSYQKIRNENRYYLGTKASMGTFLNSRFYGINIEYGGFFNKSAFEQQTLSIELQHITKLISIGKWKIRNFAKLNYLLGHNRLNSPADKLSLHQDDYLGMAGFRSDRGLIGQQKLMLQCQVQTYTPYQFLGFRISPFFNAMFSAIGNNNKFILNNNPIYSRFTLGVMLTNDYFVFSNISFSFSFYPIIPGQGNNILKTNSIDNKNFNMMDFNFSKPSYNRWNRWD